MSFLDEAKKIRASRKKQYLPYGEEIKRRTAALVALFPELKGVWTPKHTFHGDLILKQVREAAKHKADNLLDMAGYADGYMESVGNS